MTISRREFVSGLVVSGAASTISAIAPAAEHESTQSSLQPGTTAWNTEVDFRYAPKRSQATICFPDDHHKSVVGQAGDLRYGFPKALMVGMEDFSLIVEFSLAGFPDDRIVRQWVEAPKTPIIHTILDRPAATMEIVSFATREEGEGRVDNVLLKVKSKAGKVAIAPKIRIRSCTNLGLEDYNAPLASVINRDTKALLMLAENLGGSQERCIWWEEAGYTLYLPHAEVTAEKEARYFIRLPQENQSAQALRVRSKDPDSLLGAARHFWSEWKPFSQTAWSYPKKHGEFLTACARNIQQAREEKDGRLVFQVGPTVYRGLWIVDGHFLLEAARYLGYDKEADETVRAEWAKQTETGQVVASAGGEHWKDTAIAMFTLVRQCELKQDWSLFRELEPNLLRAIDFLIGLRDQGRAGGSTNGRYGLLAPGFADGGIDGVRSEFTNTVWALAGLRAVGQAGQQLGIKSSKKAAQFHNELYAALQGAAKREMVRSTQGFNYLPMLAHDDPSVNDPDPWNRPRPQTAQWALSHAIYPGLVFEKDDPIVRGHIALMQSCTEEDVPIETGWEWHDSLWNYNASFTAHVYLWAGLRDWAHRTFTGFLNHASPLYCWREEQPLQRALVGQDWGDMPHNWASAECVRFLRHMLALEDGGSLRLLDGVTASELKAAQPYTLQNSPTRFGRIDLQFEPAGTRSWRARFQRHPGPDPETVSVPFHVGTLRFDRIVGASHKITGSTVNIDPRQKTWEIFWK